VAAHQTARACVIRATISSVGIVQENHPDPLSRFKEKLRNQTKIPYKIEPKTASIKQQYHFGKWCKIPTLLASHTELTYPKETMKEHKYCI
jgi:hypothetical protein